jgi:Cu-processing system permease protein
VTALSDSSIQFCKSRPFLANLLTIARRELRDAIGSRWFILYTFAFAALGLGVSYASGASAGGSGVAGYGRTSAGLINLVLLVVPLMALTAGAGAIASDRERGMLGYLLSQPISRTELLLGKFLGLAGALASSLLLGFGVCAAVLATQGSQTNPDGLIRLAALSLLLAIAMLSVGLLISTFARRANVAIGTSIFVWLALVFATDLVLMAATLTLDLTIEQLFGLSMLNPMQVFKMWSLQSIEASLDVLGPAGLYAQETFHASLSWMFAGTLVAWSIIPLCVAIIRFKRSSIT